MRCVDLRIQHQHQDRDSTIKIAGTVICHQNIFGKHPAFSSSSRDHENYIITSGGVGPTLTSFRRRVISPFSLQFLHVTLPTKDCRLTVVKNTLEGTRWNHTWRWLIKYRASIYCATVNCLPEGRGREGGKRGVGWKGDSGRNGGDNPSGHSE